jgi:hypothetical protein
VRGAGLFLAAGGTVTDDVRGFLVLWGSVLPLEAPHRGRHAALPAVTGGHAMRAVVAALLIAAIAATACTGSSSPPPTASPGTAPAAHAGTPGAPGSTAGASSGSGSGSGSVVWLCRPGMADNPCTVSPDATSVGPSGARAPVPASDAADPPYNCFYVYPTVVGGNELNAPLEVQPVIRETAIEQASQFSRACQVWAPVYRQATLRGLLASARPGSAVAATAYDSIVPAWREFLARDDGKPIIVIGHSQGASILIKLLQQEVDPDPSVRSLLVSAILLGGNVQVPTGRSVGGTFQHLPLCTAPGQAGCVIAYSSFASTPPSDSLFGIPGQGVSLLSGQYSGAGQQVACVNPAAIGGGTAPLQPYFASVNATGTTASWVTYPQLYTAECKTVGNTTWLQVTDVASGSDHRPVVQATNSAAWGLHRYDVNLALGNLVADVLAQEAAYLPRPLAAASLCSGTYPEIPP